MIYARLPTATARDALEQLRRQAVGRMSQRAHLILLAAQHQSVPELAALFALRLATVRSWIDRVDTLGPVGLADAPHGVARGDRCGARPAAARSASRWLAGDLLDGDYAQLGLAPDARGDAQFQRAGRVRRGLHRLGLGRRRPRLMMPHKVDPAKAATQWRIVEAVVTAAPETAIFYADEARIQLLPLVRAMWQWVDQHLRIPTPGSNDSRTVFGALDIDTGQWISLVRPRARTEDFLAFLEHLVAVHPGRPLLLIIDYFSSHKAHLNPVEGIWRRLKSIVAPNRLYGSMTLLLETVYAFFAAMTPEQALTWAGHKA